MIDEIMNTFDDTEYTKENKDIIREILTTENEELINTLQPQNDSLYYTYEYIFKKYLKLKLTKEKVQLIMQCRYKVYGKMKVFSKFDISDPKIEQYFDDQDLALIYLNQTCHGWDTYHFFNMKRFDLKYYQEIYEESAKLEDEETGENQKYNIKSKIAILCLMINDEKYLKNFDVINKLELLLKEYISYCKVRVFNINNNQVENVEKFEKFDINKDEFYGLQKVYNEVSIDEFMDFMAFILLNKSETLDKYAFMVFANRNLKSITSKQVELENTCVTDEIKENIKEFISKYEKHKFKLTCSLESLYKDDKLSIKHFIEYAYSIGYGEFVEGKSNKLDDYSKMVVFESEIEHNNPFTNIVREKAILLTKFLEFSKEFKKEITEDLQNRLDLILLNTLDYDDRIFKDKLIHCSNFSDDFELSISYLEKIYRNISYNTKLEKELRNDFKNNKITKLLNAVIVVFGNNDEYNQKLIKEYKDYQALYQGIILYIIDRNMDKYEKDFLEINDTSKALIDVTIQVYKNNPHLADKLLNELKSSKIAERKTAFSIISKAYGGKFINEIKQAHEVEKNAKFKEEIEIFMSQPMLLDVDNCSTNTNTNTNSTEVTTKETEIDLDKIVSLLLKNEKLISSIPIDKFTKIKNTKNSKEEQVDINLVKASLMAFAKDKVLKICPLADSIVVDFDKDTHELFAKDLFNFYLSGDVDTKLKWILYYCSIYGGDGVVDLYVKAINHFSELSRYALAVDTLKALVLNSSPRALIIVEELSRKGKPNSIKKSSKDALKFMAEELNLTSEELSDRLIPTFGFDTQNELEFDYGTRKFKVYLNSKLELEVLDENAGKTMKNLPKIGVNDDELIAKKSSDEFKAMKKQLNATIKTQTDRLELALIKSRKWSYENFDKTFIKNPFMNKFATSLIWGIYQDKKLIDSFRYNNDGSFSNIDDEEFIVKDDMIIGLVHPLELAKELLTKWKEQLEDYEITQPIQQINREIFIAKDNKIDENIVYSGQSLKSKLLKIGYEISGVEFGEYVNNFNYYDENHEVLVELECTDIPFSYYDSNQDECNLKKVTFNNMNDLIVISEFYRVLSIVKMYD